MLAPKLKRISLVIDGQEITVKLPLAPTKVRMDDGSPISTKVLSRANLMRIAKAWEFEFLRKAGK